MPGVGAWVASAMGVIASLCCSSSVCAPLHTAQTIESFGFMGFMHVLKQKFSSSAQRDSSQASWELLVLAHSV